MPGSTFCECAGVLPVEREIVATSNPTIHFGSIVLLLVCFFLLLVGFWGIRCCFCFFFSFQKLKLTNHKSREQREIKPKSLDAEAMPTLWRVSCCTTELVLLEYA